MAPHSQARRGGRSGAFLAFLAFLALVAVGSGLGAAGAAASPTPPPAAARSAATVTSTDEAPPQLAVKGTQLVDGSGHDLQLRGVTRAGFEYACVQDRPIADGPVDDPAIEAMTAWGVNAVRLTLNGPCWLGDPLVPPRRRGPVYRAAVEDLVHRLQRHGLVAILALQWDAAGPAAVRTGQLPMPDAVLGPAFWSSVATTFRAEAGIAFELHSEPYGVSWTCWRDGCVVPPTQVPGKAPVPAYRAAGMQQLVDAVRKVGANQPLLISGLDWGNDLSGWSGYAPRDPLRSLVASLHVYDRTRCHDEQCWTAMRAATATVPLIASELGDHTCTGSLAVRFARWADRRGASYLAWTWNPWDCTAGPALLKDWSGTPTPYGAAWRAQLLSRRPAGT